MKFKDWLETSEPFSILIIPSLNEGAGTNSRYSVEVNYRTTIEDVMKGAAKIVLGFVSAALKQNDYHVKHVYNEEPLRILISSRNWDDGEWVGVVNYNPKENCFIVSKGFYNRDRKTVSIQGSKKCSGDNAAAIVRELRSQMHSLQSQPDRFRDPLKPVSLKTGPKPKGA